MSHYPNADAIIADAELRLDRFGRESGILVVEGPDDKRFFCKRTRSRQQVLAAGGRRVLLAAHAIASARDLGIVFLTDCDYEVKLKTLTPKWDLITSHHADLESDLLAYGGYEQLVVQLVIAALEDDGYARRAANDLRDRAVALADPLGRMRQIAKIEGFEIDTEVWHHKYRRDYASEVDEQKLVRAVIQASRESTLTFVEMSQRAASIAKSYNNCNGHDLIAAVHHVLRDDFAVRGQTVETTAQMLRNSISDSQFSNLPTTHRLRLWEKRSGRQLLNDPA